MSMIDAAADARRKALLLQARKQRVAWVQDEDYEERDVVQEAMRASFSSSSSSSSSVQKKRGTLTGLSETVPGLDHMLPAARQCVGFLNELAGEDSREVVEYAAEALLTEPTVEELWLQAGDDDDATMPPLPPALNDAAAAKASLSYGAFTQCLTHPVSLEIVKAMQRFVSAFVQSQRRRRDLATSPSSSGPQGEHLHAFIDSLRSELRKNEAWQARAASAASWEEMREHFEKFLVVKLHRYLFTDAEAAALVTQEAVWRARVQSLAFLGPEHLEVRSLLNSSSVSQVLAPAIQEFNQVVSYKAPADTMACLLRCSHLVSHALIESRAPGTGLPGADEFLPAMILMVKESNPVGLMRALEVVQRYRHPSRLQVSEPAYVFTNTMSAVHFLETADAAQLDLTPESFERSLLACSPRVTADASDEKRQQEQERRRASSSVSSVLSPLINLNLDATQGSNTLSLSHTTCPESISGSQSACQSAPGLSIQDVRLERMAARTAAIAAVNGAPVGQSSNAPFGSSAPPSFSPPLQSLVERVRNSRGGRSAGDSQQLKQACTYLAASPQDLRVSDVALLLDEYRSLAALAGECLDMLGRQQSQHR